jgi:hypothetical protein
VGGKNVTAITTDTRAVAAPSASADA